MTAQPTLPETFLSLGFAAVDWIEHYLVHGPGDVQGQPVDLDDEFAAFIVKAYRVNKRGARVVRRAFLSRSKGRSKSGLAAMIACFEALGPCRFDHFAVDGEVSAWGYEYETGEPVGRPLTYVEILNVATEESQAGNTYDAIHYMLNPETASAELVRDFGKIDVGLTRTNLPNKRGFIEPVTSADNSKDGGKSTFIVADETHLWVLPRLKRLHGVMTRNLLKRKIASGWMLETSTMYGEGDESVAEGTHAYAKTAKRDGSLLFDHRQASDTWDLNKRGERLKALKEAYGPAAAWMNLDAISDSWDDPQVSEGEFRRYWLNQPVPTEAPDPSIFDLTRWHLNEDPDSEAEAVLAFGIAVALDRSMTAIAATGHRPDAAVHVELIDYRAHTGWVVARCLDLDAEHGPAPFVVDGAGPAASLIEPLQRAGLEIVVLTARDVGKAAAWLVDSVRDGLVFHGPQLELTTAVEGAKKRSIGDGLFAFGRRLSTVQIAPLEAVMNAVHVLPSIVALDDVTAAYM